MIRQLNRPAFTSTQVFNACIGSQISAANLALLAPLVPAIAGAENEYDANAAIMQLNLVAKEFACPDNSRSTLKEVYKNRMATPGKAGRPFYDDIILGDGRPECPYCGIGSIRSLDHYLPKGQYLGHTVNPANLIPSCRDCQDEKKEHDPANIVDQVFHPYFEPFVYVRWLYASVVNIGGPVVLFFAENRSNLDAVVFERLECHLAVFGLKERFKDYVATRLSEDARLFQKHGQNAGTLRAYLDSELETVDDGFIWKRPYLEALRNSDWFCTEGFMVI